MINQRPTDSNLNTASNSANLPIDQSLAATDPLPTRGSPIASFTLKVAALLSLSYVSAQLLCALNVHSDRKLDLKYASGDKELTPIFAAFALYRDWVPGEEKTTEFGPDTIRRSASHIKMLSNPSKDPEIDGAIREASILISGYTPQARANLAFKILLRQIGMHATIDPKFAFPEQQKQDLELPFLTRRRATIWLKNSMQAITDVALVDTADVSTVNLTPTGIEHPTLPKNTDQRWFARRVEAQLDWEKWPTFEGPKHASSFFESFARTDITPKECAEFLCKNKLDQSALLRELFNKKAKTSSYYKEVLDNLPTLTSPITPLAWKDFVLPLGKLNPVMLEIAQLQEATDTLNEAACLLWEAEEAEKQKQENSHPLPAIQNILP